MNPGIQGKKPNEMEEVQRLEGLLEEKVSSPPDPGLACYRCENISVALHSLNSPIISAIGSQAAAMSSN